MATGLSNSEHLDPAPSGMDRRNRVIWVIDEFVGTSHKHKYLEKRTGIKARRWQNMCYGAQEPSLDMIGALAEYEPHFLSWMITGRALGHGQVNPEEEGWHGEVLAFFGLDQFADLSLKELLEMASRR